MSDVEEEIESTDDIQNDNWVKSNLIDLMQKYPREWVAVMSMIVIANASTKGDVIKMADGIASGQEYSIYFIPATSTSTDVGYATR